QVTFADHVQLSGDFIVENGSVDASNATVEFQVSYGTIDAQDSSFGDVILTGSSITLASDLDVDGDLEIRSVSSLQGANIVLSGDLDSQDGSVSGSAGIILDGDGAQTLDVLDLPNGDFVIDKPSGTVVLDSDLNLQGSGQDLEIQNGELILGGHEIAVGGEVDVNGGTLSGAGTINGDLSISNSGTIQLSVPGTNPGDYEQLTVEGSVDVGADSHLALDILTLSESGSVQDLIVSNTHSGDFGTVESSSGTATIRSAIWDADHDLDLILDPAFESPQVEDGLYEIPEDGTLLIEDLLGSSSGGLAVTSVAQPSHGTLTDHGDGSLTYAPDENFHGTDTFTYTAIDSDGSETTATIEIEVTPENDAATADAGSDQSVSGTDVVILAGSGEDVDGDALSYEWVQVSGPTVALDDSHSPNPRFTAPDCLCNTVITFELHVSDGTSESVDTVDITVEADNDPPVADAGLDLVVEEGDVVTLSAGGGDEGGSGTTVDFNDVPIDSYAGSGQDISAVATVEDGGSTLHLTGNGWKSIEFPAAITEDTVLSFDFKVTELGEIHGIGFDNDSSLSPEQTFKLGGTQTWGIDGAVDLYSGDGEWVHFEIPIGEFYTGEFDSLFFANDHDSGPSDAESYYRNITISDGTNSAPTHDVEGEELTYTWVQTGGPTVVLDDNHATSPTFTAPEGLADTEITFELHVSDGTNETVDMVTITVEADNDAPVANAGSDFAVEEGGLVSLTASGGAGTSVDFNEVSIDSYAGSGQDISAVATVEGDGSTLHIEGNGWKSIEFPATITEDTVLSFDFKATELGEIHGIGFDNDSSLSPDQTFKLGGSQTWGIDGAVDPYTVEGEWVHFEIPIGEFYTGDFDNLFFANDHDAGPSDAESFFRNISIFDGTEPAPTHDAEGEELTYTWVQTGGPTVVLDDPHATSPTFTAPSGDEDSELTFELHVSDGTNESVDTINITIEANNNIPVANAGTDIEVEEGGLVSLAASGGTSVDFNDVSIDSYAGSGQDISAVATVEDNGATLHLNGNGWKSIEFPATITEDTVLSFDFKATELGEIHGIGFDNDSSLSPDQTFKIGGTQTWGIGDAVDPYTADGEWVHFEIPIGEFYTGDFDSLFFANDHDAGPSDAESFFRNITISDGTESAPTHNDDGEALTYTWVQTGGPIVVLDDPHATSPTFTAPEGLTNSEITFELQVTDGSNTATDTVTVNVNADNDAPTAEAGQPQTVEEGDTVTLAGSGTDPEGEGLNYQWVQTGGPTVTLDDPTSASPTFTAPEGLSNTDITFELHVSDGTNESIDTVDITVEADNDAPTSQAGPAQTVAEGDSVSLAGSGTDPEGEGLTYQWVQTGGPTVTLDDPTSASPSFTAPEGLSNTDITFELHVSDGTNESVDTVTIEVEADNDAPTSQAGPAQTVTEGDTVSLAGSGTDPEGEGLTYEWVQTGGPTVTLDDPTSSNPSFTAPDGTEDTDIVFEFHVSDGTNGSVDTVSITVKAEDQPADEPSDDPQGETEDEPEVQPEGEPSETPPADTDEDPEGQPADEPSDDPQGETEDQPGDGPSDDPQGETEDDPADEPVTQEVDGPSEAPADDEEGDPGVEVEGNPEATDVPNSEPTLEPASIGQSDVSVENETEDSVEALPAPASAARSGLFGDYTVLYDLDQIMDESLDGDEDKIRDLNLELAQESKGQEAVPNVNDDAHEMWEASDREFDDIQFEISEGVQKEGLKSMLWAFLLRAASAVGLSERVKVDEDQDAKK
ncbi:MAG: tandem-95 repeat protein, partial [Planctomycetota bacterium]